MNRKPRAGRPRNRECYPAAQRGTYTVFEQAPPTYDDRARWQCKSHAPPVGRIRNVARHGEYQKSVETQSIHRGEHATIEQAAAADIVQRPNAMSVRGHVWTTPAGQGFIWL
jgi:hypothetical protein